MAVLRIGKLELQRNFSIGGRSSSLAYAHYHNRRYAFSVHVNVSRVIQPQ